MMVEATLTFTFYVEADRVAGSYSRYMGHGTSLTVGGVEQRDDRSDPDRGLLYAPVPRMGQTLTLGIPSGEFSGVVARVESIDSYGDQLRLAVVACGSWDGKHAGLMGGLSCYGGFVAEVNSDAAVVSSWGSMSWHRYCLLRSVRAEWGEEGLQALLAIG